MIHSEFSNAEEVVGNPSEPCLMGRIPKFDQRSHDITGMYEDEYELRSFGKAEEHIVSRSHTTCHIPVFDHI